MVAGAGAAESVDYGLMAAGTATSFLDLGVLSYVGYWAAKQGYRIITELECGTDVFVALSLLVLFRGAVDSLISHSVYSFDLGFETEGIRVGSCCRTLVARDATDEVESGLGVGRPCSSASRTPRAPSGSATASGLFSPGWCWRERRTRTTS